MVGYAYVVSHRLSPVRHDIGRFDDGVQAVQIAYSDGPRRSNTSRSTPEYLGACGSIFILAFVMLAVSA